MSHPLLIYGATGYTGQLVARAALEIGLRPILAGRNEPKLAALARELGLEYRVGGLTNAHGLDVLLHDIEVVLHLAGPFSQTSKPMVNACLRTGAHYLDICGEVPVIEELASRADEARRRGIMMMPAVGFDAVPSDCLAAHVAARLPRAERLAFGILGLELATRGSAKTLIEHAAHGVKVRRNGQITTVPAGALEREFDYGEGLRLSLNVSWADVSCAYHTTGIPNIEVYLAATAGLRGMLVANRYFGWLLATSPWQASLKAYADLLPDGPSEAQRAASRMVIVAEAQDRSGRHVISRLGTPEAYTFTAATAAAIAKKTLQSEREIGFQTPGRVYGADFVLSFRGVGREDVQ